MAYVSDWDCKPVFLQWREGAKPYHGRPFPIPKKHMDITKKEIKWLCNLGVLQQQADSEQALPTFIISKKDNTLRDVRNFRELNKRIVRKPFLIPKISAVLQELEGFTYATTLDLYMGSRPLDWIQMHPQYAPLSFRGVNTLTYDYQWVLHVLLTSSKLRCLS